MAKVKPQPLPTQHSQHLSLPHLSTVYGGGHSHRPVEDGRAVGAHRRVAVEGEQHISLPAELAHKALGLAPLQVRQGGQCSLPGRGVHPPELPSHLPTWLVGAHLTVQFDVLGKQRVGLSQRAAQPARVRVQQVLHRVHLIVLHKVLPVLELQAQPALSCPHISPPNALLPTLPVSPIWRVHP